MSILEDDQMMLPFMLSSLNEHEFLSVYFLRKFHVFVETLVAQSDSSTHSDFGALSCDRVGLLVMQLGFRELREGFCSGSEPSGGDCKTLMIVQINTSATDLRETISCLKFANRVRGIEHGPAWKRTDILELFKYK
ncbi:hypothetical protein RHGRI_025802 [Rhododendron griersonianum]|uniref:Kinesin motor domain-containing protein n=1 Tax=Rhododendron griersonianum TaxID=479676 RepID=A0AAV6IRQ2_9ERIC|nr:hypothetical protein RHGRI_025802 [Rhododendron griersonianum]